LQFRPPGLKIALLSKNSFMTDKKHDQPTSQPDPETLHTTDPEEHMKGPFSSAMNKIRKNAEGNDHRNREERNVEDERTTEDQDQVK
jgi:hypothetical protein